MKRAQEKKVKGNNLLPFLFFLFVSCCLWLLQVMNEQFETDIPVSVRVENIPRGIKFEEGDLAEFRVLVRDEGIVLMQYELGEKPELVVDYSELRDADGHLSIPTAVFKNKVAAMLEPTTEIVQFLSETVSFDIMKNAKDVPVRLNLDVQVPAKFSLDYVDYEPKTVTVAAIADVLNEIDSIDTELLSGIVLDENKSVSVALVAGKNVKIDPQTVTVNFSVSQKLERDVLVPLNLVGFPENAFVLGLPDFVDVSYRVAKAHIDNVKPSDFVVELNYYDYENATGDSVALSVVTSSPYVEDVSFSPMRVKKVETKPGSGWFMDFIR